MKSEDAREARLTVADKKGWVWCKVSQNKAGRGRRKWEGKERGREVRLGGMGMDEREKGLRIEKGKKEKKNRKRREEKGKKAQKDATS
ncbi:hypothetical protein M752DRAFT_276863 [Aspergillus phoenicis ATCC 13157]|uniref:Uncharacterized protein n=1 Tax=Aspergillus phoenicis ATCC 13157 TaxID=1353007 RepID=A0A370PGN8_ASPPH|nr:hypothetical protein M752DRAFT_276863 [Aspergillus phoenicis ATCC 13157]